MVGICYALCCESVFLESLYHPLLILVDITEQCIAIDESTNVSSHAARGLFSASCSEKAQTMFSQ